MQKILGAFLSACTADQYFMLARSEGWSRRGVRILHGDASWNMAFRGQRHVETFNIEVRESDCEVLKITQPCTLMYGAIVLLVKYSWNSSQVKLIELERLHEWKVISRALFPRFKKGSGCWRCAALLGRVKGGERNGMDHWKVAEEGEAGERGGVPDRSNREM